MSGAWDLELWTDHRWYKQPQSGEIGGGPPATIYYAWIGAASTGPHFANFGGVNTLSGTAGPLNGTPTGLLPRL